MIQTLQSSQVMAPRWYKPYSLHRLWHQNGINLSLHSLWHQNDINLSLHSLWHQNDTDLTVFTGYGTKMVQTLQPSQVMAPKWYKPYSLHSLWHQNGINLSLHSLWHQNDTDLTVFTGYGMVHQQFMVPKR